jgi:alpha-L-fucosidase 2
MSGIESQPTVAPETGRTTRREFRLWYRQPASTWLQALPLGNGRLGAMAWGDPQRERVDLNIDTLWSGGPRTFRPEGCASTLAALHAAVLERRAYPEADALALDLQGSFNEA